MGGDSAHLAGHDCAAGGGEAHGLAGAHLAELGSRNFGAPFKTALADQAEQFLTLGHHGADGGGRGAEGDHAVVAGQHTGVAQAQVSRVEAGLRSELAGFGGGFYGEVLLDLLRAEGDGGIGAAGAGGVGTGFQQGGVGFGQAGAGLGLFGEGHVGGEFGQYFALFDAGADVHLDVHQAQPAGFGAEGGFLPGGDAAVGGQATFHVAGFGLDGDHRQRRLGRAGRGSRRRCGGGFGSAGAAGEQAGEGEQGEKRHTGGNHWASPARAAWGAMGVSGWVSLRVQPPPTAR